jgi:hypothetical protein
MTAYGGVHISIKEAQENQERLQLNGLHQLLVYDDDDDVHTGLFDEIINTMKKII